MPDDVGETIHPRDYRVSVSQDKAELALVFHSQGRTPLTVILAMPGAAGLQRKLARCLYMLGIRTATAKDGHAADPALH